MIKDIKLPQAIVICVVFLGTLAGVWLFANAGLDPTPAVLLGSGVLAALGIGTMVAQNQQIKDQTNGTTTAQLATIRHLAAILAVSHPTPEMRELAMQLAAPPPTTTPIPAVAIPAAAAPSPAPDVVAEGRSVGDTAPSERVQTVPGVPAPAVSEETTPADYDG